MTKLFRLFSILVLFAATAYAQTVVSFTATDSDGQTWNNGTYNITFVPTPNKPGPYTVNGVAFNQGPFTGTLNNSGVGSLTLTDNTTISPAGSQWLFVVCPNATSRCGQITLTISGGSQNISTQLNAILPVVRFSTSNGSTVVVAYGYADAEVSPVPVNGGQYWNVTSNCQRIWSGLSWNCSTGTIIDLSSPPPIGNVTPNTINATYYNNICQANTQSGSDACAQINSCVSALPVTGGIIDARSFQGTLSCSTALTLSKPLSLDLGAVILQIPQVQISSANVKITGIMDNFFSYSSPCGTMIQSNAANALIDITGGGGYTLQNLCLDGNSKQGLTGVFDPLYGNGQLNSVRVTNFANDCVYMRSGENHTDSVKAAHCGGDGIVMGNDSEMNGLTEIYSAGESYTANGFHGRSGGQFVTRLLTNFNTGNGAYFDGTAPVNFAINTVYKQGDEILPTSGNAGSYIYICTIPGTSGGSAPTWTQSVGALVVSGGATFVATQVLYNASGTQVAELNSTFNTGHQIYIYGSPNQYSNSSFGNVIAYMNWTGSTTSTDGVYAKNTNIISFPSINCEGSALANQTDQGCLILDDSQVTVVGSFNAVYTHKNALTLKNGTSRTTFGAASIVNNADSTTTGTDRYAIFLADNSIGYTNFGGLTIEDSRNADPYSAGIYNHASYYTKCDFYSGGNLIDGTGLPNDWGTALAQNPMCNYSDNSVSGDATISRFLTGKAYWFDGFTSGGTPTWGANSITKIEATGITTPDVGVKDVTTGYTHSLNTTGTESANYGLTLPNANGTIPANASSPLVLNVTTGNLTCPTCTFSASLTTTTATSDNVSITGVTSSSKCSLTPTNSSAATNVATTYISAFTSNQITVAHTVTSGMTYSILCSAS